MEKNINLKKILFFITIFVFSTGFCCIKNLPDNDLWARIIAGGYFTEFHAVLKHDFLSYTPTHEWLDHEWGASVIFYNVFKYFNQPGLIILKGVLTALTLLFCHLTVKLRNKSAGAYNILYYLFMCFCVMNTIGHTIRCLLFTCLFFAVFIYILERARLGRNKSLIFLPLIMIFWGNIHGGCISGLGILLIYALGEFLNGRKWAEYIYAFIICLLMLFINPYGFKYVKFLFYASFMQRTYIFEWLSPFHHMFKFLYLKYKFYLILMFIVQTAYIIRNKITYKKLDKTKFLIVILTAFLSAVHIRHINFFILTAGTLLYDEFYQMYNSVVSRFKLTACLNSSRLKEVIAYSVILLIFIPISGNKKILKLSGTNCPVYAVEFVKINNLKGNLFMNFDWGSYASYKLYPNNLIAMDGRYEEVYNPDLLLMIKDFHLVKNDWNKIIKDFKTDVMILEKKYPVYNKILNDKNWSLVFENNIAGVFVPQDKVSEQYLYPEPNPAYYDEKVLDTDISFINKDKLQKR